MERRAYTTRGGVKQYKAVMSTDEFEDSDSAGWCLACGTEASGVEPDARGYTCEGCGAAKVFGLEELLVMGLLVLTSDEDEDEDEDGGGE